VRRTEAREVCGFLVDPLLLFQPVELDDGIAPFLLGQVAVSQFEPELVDLLRDGDDR
jgi:hypothetical protein